MTDFEILSLVIMIASLVLNAIKFGRGGKGKKKESKAAIQRELVGGSNDNGGEEPYQKRHPFLPLL